MNETENRENNQEVFAKPCMREDWFKPKMIQSGEKRPEDMRRGGLDLWLREREKFKITKRFDAR